MFLGDLDRIIFLSRNKPLKWQAKLSTFVGDLQYLIEAACECSKLILGTRLPLECTSNRENNINTY